MENTKDLSKITLAEVLNALQAQEQRRLIRQNDFVESALPAKHQDTTTNNKKKNHKEGQTSSVENPTNNNNRGGSSRNYPPCQYCKKKGIHLSNVGGDQMQSVTNAISLDMKL